MVRRNESRTWRPRSLWGSVMGSPTHILGSEVSANVDIALVQRAWHRRAIELADELTATAQDMKTLPVAMHWTTTISKLYAAAESLRWEVRWERRGQ